MFHHFLVLSGHLLCCIKVVIDCFPCTGIHETHIISLDSLQLCINNNNKQYFVISVILIFFNYSDFFSTHPKSPSMADLLNFTCQSLHIIVNIVVGRIIALGRNLHCTAVFQNVVMEY